MKSMREWTSQSVGTASRFLAAAILGLLIAGPVWAADENPPVVPINVNTADAATLDRVLLGVGPERAQAIIDYREENGEFSDIADLANVKGIGLATVARNQERIVAE